jgi:phage-related baseplate assembly protein
MVRSAALWSASAMASLMVALDLDAACGRVAAVFDVYAVSLRAADPEALVLDH